MKVLTVGGAMVDTIAIVESERIERMAMRNADAAYLLLEEGRKTEASEISTHVGGGAVNAAVGMARLGFDVACLVKLGKDQRAETVLKRLMEEKISTRWVVRDGRAPTGAAVMVSSHEHDAAIFTFRGANTLLETCDLPGDSLAVDLVYISSLSNESAACFPDLTQRAKAAGAMVATNPGIRQLSARGGDFLESLANLDILTLNRREAGAVVPALVAQFGEGGPTVAAKRASNLPALLVQGLEGGGFEMTLTGFCSALASLGVATVLVTDGARGTFAAHGGELYHCPIAKGRSRGHRRCGRCLCLHVCRPTRLRQGRARRTEGRRLQCRQRGHARRHPNRAAGSRRAGKNAQGPGADIKSAQLALGLATIPIVNSPRLRWTRAFSRSDDPDNALGS